MVTRRSFPFVRKAVMSLPAADKSVWEIKMKGGGVPLRSAGCVVSVAVHWGKQCRPAGPAYQPAGPAYRAWGVLPTPPEGWIQVTLGCLSLQIAFWGAGRRATHPWGLFWGCVGQVCSRTACFSPLWALLCRLRTGFFSEENCGTGPTVPTEPLY